MTVEVSEGALPPRMVLSDESGASFSLVSSGRVRIAHFLLPESATGSCLWIEWSGRTGPLGFTFHTSATSTALVRALAGRGDERLRAVALLPRLGAAAVAALEEAFDEMPPRERRDALKVYASLRRDPRAKRRLLDAATDPDPSIRRLAVEGLDTGGLVEAARRGSAEALARASREQPSAVATLALERLGGEPPYDDARTALAQAAWRLPADALEELAAAVQSLPPHARARAVEVLVAVRPLRPHLIEPIGALLEEGGRSGGRLDDARFEQTYRAVRAAAGLDAAEGQALVAPLSRLREAEEWMLRAAVYRALASLGAPLDVVSRGLGDSYPRVRIAALEAAVGLGGAPALATALRAASSDPWSSVRAAAVSLGGREGLALGDVSDPSPRVRLALLVSWLGRPTRLDELREALAREDHLGVRGGVLIAAAERCVAGLDEAAREVLNRAGTDDEDARHASGALDYLLAFEGEERDTLVATLRARGVPPSQLSSGPRCARKNGL